MYLNLGNNESSYSLSRLDRLIIADGGLVGTIAVDIIFPTHKHFEIFGIRWVINCLI